MLKQYRSDYEVISEKVKTKNGVNGYLTKGEVNEGELELITMTYWFKNKSNIYSIAQFMEKDKLKDYETTFTRMVDSFDWVQE